MAITKEQKKEILQDLVAKFGRSKSIVFSDYRGLDVASVSDLRNRLREKGAETKVAKKTLIRLAAKESSIGELGDDIMEGPVSVTFSYEDEMAGLKALFNFSKENENLKLLGGVINGEVVGADEIIQLAKLPGREELLAKFMGSINAPVSGFVGTLNNLVGGFVRVLSAYKDSLPAEVVEEVPKEEPKAEESADTAEHKGDAVETQHAPSPDETDDETTDEPPAEESKEEEKSAATEPSSDEPAEEGDEEKKEE